MRCLYHQKSCLDLISLSAKCIFGRVDCMGLCQCKGTLGVHTSHDLTKLACILCIHTYHGCESTTDGRKDMRKPSQFKWKQSPSRKRGMLLATPHFVQILCQTPTTFLTSSAFTSASEHGAEMNVRTLLT